MHVSPIRAVIELNIKTTFKLCFSPLRETRPIRFHFVGSIAATNGPQTQPSPTGTACAYITGCDEYY